jgi:hypothetical protein
MKVRPDQRAGRDAFLSWRRVALCCIADLQSADRTIARAFPQFWLASRLQVGATAQRSDAATKGRVQSKRRDAINAARRSRKSENRKPKTEGTPKSENRDPKSGTNSRSKGHRWENGGRKISAQFANNLHSCSADIANGLSSPRSSRLCVLIGAPENSRGLRRFLEILEDCRSAVLPFGVALCTHRQGCRRFQ